MAISIKLANKRLRRKGYFLREQTNVYLQYESPRNFFKKKPNLKQNAGNQDYTFCGFEIERGEPTLYIL